MRILLFENLDMSYNNSIKQVVARNRIMPAVGSAAQRLSGSAAQRLSGSAAQRCSGAAAQAALWQ